MIHTNVTANRLARSLRNAAARLFRSGPLCALALCALAGCGVDPDAAAGAGGGTEKRFTCTADWQCGVGQYCETPYCRIGCLTNDQCAPGLYCGNFLNGVGTCLSVNPL